jgi:xylulokinase
MLLGIDVGTSSTKVLLLDERGETVGEAGGQYSVERGRRGWAETHPEEWWTATGAAVRALPADARGAVRGIGVSGQMHGAVLCDPEGTPLRSAVLWLDTRSAECLELYPPGAEHITGNAISAGMTGPVLLWLGRYEPEVVRAARWALQPKDWVRLRLTGEAASDPSDASGTLLADRDGVWADSLVSKLGIRRELLAPTVSSWAEAGQLTRSAASALGLPVGVPVAAGAGDTLAAAFGSGLHDGSSGQLAIGTSAQVLEVLDVWPGFSPRLNLYRNANVPGAPRWCLMAAMLNGGAALDWARATLGLSWSEAYARAFEADAREGEPVFLPYLAGERTPWIDPHVRGGWIGVTASDNAGTLMRATFTGVGFAIRAGLDALREKASVPARLRLAGGGAVHPRFQQLLADILQVPLDEVMCPNAAARGAALLGGLAAGAIAPTDLPALAPTPRPAADPQDGAELSEKYLRFRELYALLAEWFRRGDAAQRPQRQHPSS